MDQPVDKTVFAPRGGGTGATDLFNAGDIVGQYKIEKVLGPGASSSVVINPLKPGEYPFFDEFHPQTSKGRIVAK